MQPVAAGETRTGRMDAPAVLDGPFFCSLYWPGLRRSRRTPPRGRHAPPTGSARRASALVGER